MSEFLDYDVSVSLKIVCILENSADPDEMPPYVAFHLGQCRLMQHFIWAFTVCQSTCLPVLPKYLFTCIQNEKG